MYKYYLLIDTDTKKKYEFETKKELFHFLQNTYYIINFEIKEDYYGLSVN